MRPHDCTVLLLKYGFAFSPPAGSSSRSIIIVIIILIIRKRMSSLSTWDQDMNSQHQRKVYKTFPGVITPTQAPRKIIINTSY